MLWNARQRTYNHNENIIILQSDDTFGRINIERFHLHYERLVLCYRPLYWNRKMKNTNTVNFNELIVLQKYYSVTVFGDRITLFELIKTR